MTVELFGLLVMCLRDREGDWFKSSVLRKVGNGENTLFWEDVWVGDVNLKSAFPRLYALSLGKGCTVAESGEWVDDRWVWGKGWRREFRGWELESLAKLSELLVCRKTATAVPDRWIWMPESNAIYSVKSGYNTLLERKIEVDDRNVDFCKFIWNNYAVPKAQAIAWRVTFRRVATKVELRIRGVIPTNAGTACPLCNGDEETIQHLFMECSRTWSLWSSCLDWIGLQTSLNNDVTGNLLQFCNLVHNKEKQAVLASLWVCIVWIIWRKKNEVVFDSGVWNHAKAVGEIKANLWSWVRGREKWTSHSLCFSSWCSNPFLLFAGVG